MGTEVMNMEDLSQTQMPDTQFFRDVFNASPVGIAVENLEGQLLFANPALCSMLDFSEAELRSKHCVDFSPPEDAEKDWSLFQQLRAGSIDHYQIDKRYFRRDGSLLWGNLSISLLNRRPSPLVIAMVEEITDKKQAEEALRESEEKFRSVFRDAGVGMVIVSLEGRFLAANGAFCDSLGYTEEELLAKTVESVTFPDDWPAFSHKLREALTDGRAFQWFEKRCLHKSGRIVYSESSASLIRDRNGEPQYFVGEVLDVTKRKEAEGALSEMTRKLVEAQEQERARIGRELHDDVNQRLAMLAIELEQLKDNPAEVGIRVRDLRKQVTDISNDVQALSHDLHSSKLEYLGVIAGMKAWCKEFAERQGMQIHWRHEVQSTLKQEVGLCLFRVLQEALHNAAKHSGVKRIEVELRETSGEIQLVVNDLGRGFDIEEALHGKGLGLTSMSERVRLLNGTISIDSKPMRGATIHVRIPLASEHASKGRSMGTG
jgi:PAS domain S-box-containing protein